jgi:hypothetical protein
MKIKGNGHPGTNNLLSYVSQVPGAICIAGTLPLDASLYQLKQHFQTAHTSRIEPGPSRRAHLSFGLTGQGQILTAIELGAIARQIVEAEGLVRGPWQAWLHPDGVTPHIHVVACLPNPSGQGAAKCIHRSGNLPSSGVRSKVSP